MAVGHGLETRWGRRGRRPRGERGEDARGEATRDAQPRVLPELSAQGRLALGEEDGEDGEGVGEAVLHAARGQERAACFGGFAGREEVGCFFERAEFLFEEGGELRKGQRGSGEKGRAPKRNFARRTGARSLGKLQRLIFLMFACMKKRGYPVCMASRTRASPSSSPALSAHSGIETERACSVKAESDCQGCFIGP